ncbi:PadR family transcriptional regulator [Schlesneria paludicola]|uniref:PadR family transcriptional regulator n=1 Tax=Schlesneria paludicola TaxID=360056 RepID=UPI00029AEF05|nr:PadR family transcriptional regulator [Schlesneria paludicola]
MASGDKVNLLQGTLDMLILKSLHARRRHGYEITRWIQSTSDDVLTIEEGSLYPALHRLERRGWITCEWGLSESNRRAKFYELSRTGKTQLVREVDSWNIIVKGITQILDAKVLEATT